MLRFLGSNTLIVIYLLNVHLFEQIQKADEEENESDGKQFFYRKLVKCYLFEGSALEFGSKSLKSGFPVSFEKEECGNSAKDHRKQNLNDGIQNELIKIDLHTEKVIYNKSMYSSHKEEYLFHIFIQNTDTLPKQASLFPHFEFMEQSIRKTFNQVKKVHKVDKDIEGFKEFWAELTNEDKVNIYCKWGDLLKKALLFEQRGNTKPEKESVTMQDQIFVRKNFFNKWEKRIVKLTPTHFHIITSRKNKDYALKNYGLRRSKSKQNYCWVLQPISNLGKIIHCGVSSKNMFDEWFYALSCNIENQRIFYFLNTIRQGRSTTKGLKKEPHVKNSEGETMKTLTEIMIDNQMKSIDNDEFKEIEDHEDVVIEKIQEEEEEQANQMQSNHHPNIFQKLIPNYENILSFADIPVGCPLIHCQADYRIYELPSKQNETIKLKFFNIVPYPKALVFEALTKEGFSWNDDVDVVQTKTKISSENTALIYEKNKAQGILYRQRDFLYLRHCFTISEYRYKNTFIVDKSIDSIHQPPFMTVVRAEKELVWGLVEKDAEKECMIIVEGWIKGGGYMNTHQNKEMTVKFMKKLGNINGLLKQISYTNSQNVLFQEEWKVKILEESSPRVQKVGKQKMLENVESSSCSAEEEKELEEFIKKADEEIKSSAEKSQNSLSEHSIQEKSAYIPPPLNSENFVIIPQKYLNKTHIIQPKQKPKNPSYYPHYRGHHLWKGQWEVSSTGGLAYVDQQKMKEQKKVLTYIIKRIGKNILSGKGILNISLPVDIFCVESNIERLAMSFGFFPDYLEKAAKIKEAQIQLKYVISSGIASSLIYMTMQKPFNPILGETFQCWVDNCPIYFQQISHHPPIAAFFMKGRGYKVSGTVEAKMDLSINSGKGNNEGIFHIQFQNGNNFYYTTPTGVLTGLTYGERKLNFTGKSFYWTMEGLFLEINYDPGAKNRGFFGNSKGDGDEKLLDYFQGHVKRYTKEDIAETVLKKGSLIIPKSQPHANPIETYYKVCGRWTSYLKCGDEKFFDSNENRYYTITDEKYALGSHSNYREDIVHRRLRNFIDSQNFKEHLEIKQRTDRKLRSELGKKKV